MHDSSTHRQSLSELSSPMCAGTTFAAEADCCGASNSEKIHLCQALAKAKATFATPVAKVKVKALPLPPLPVKVKVVKVVW